MTRARDRCRRPDSRWRRRMLPVLPVLGTLLVASSTPLSAFQEQRPAFRGEVDRVRVDVIVKDEDGRFVEGLQAADFRLFEDDAPQRILSVDLVRGTFAAGSGNGGGLADEDVVALPARPDVVADPTTAVSPDLGAIVYLIDWRRLEPKGIARFTRALRERLGEGGELSTPRAAFLIDRNGVFRQLAPLTTDAGVLQGAVEELERLPKYGFPADAYLEPAGSPFSPVLRNEMAVLSLIEQFCSSLGTLRGRKALIWVSGGFRAGRTPFEQTPAMRERLDSLARTANSANLSIYAIDPRRTIDQEHSFYRGAFDVSRRSALGSGGRSIANELFRASMGEFSDESLRNGLVYAAEATGGMAFLSWSDVDRALDDIVEDSGSYYLLTYAPPSRIGDGRYHSIRVEVDDASLKVRYRAGYVDYREGDRRERRLAGALAAPGITPGFPLRVEPFAAAEADGQSLSLLEIAGDLPAPGRAAEAPDDLAFAMSGFAVPRGQGRTISARRWLRWRDIEVVSDTVVGGTRFVIKQGWPLGPGEYEVRVALYRPSTQEVAAARAHLCVEPAENPAEGAPAYTVRRCVE